MERALVLLAMIARRGRFFSARLKKSNFRSSCSGMASSLNSLAGGRQVCALAQPTQCRLASARRDLPFFDALGQIGLDGGARPGQRRVIDVHHRRFEAAEGRHMGDSQPHGPAASHHHTPDFAAHPAALPRKQP
jgi:hypothetical protein